MEYRWLDIEALLKQYNQEHIITYLQHLPPELQSELLKQIAAVDLEQLTVSLTNRANMQDISAEHIAPIAVTDWEKLDPSHQTACLQKGWELLREGRIAVIVVAGGQGSRLGHQGPKGTIDIGLPSRKSLFQLQAERLLNLSKRSEHSIPWYIMTSPENHEQTVSFFQASNYFGYPEEDCFFFQQNTMPAVDHQGRLLLSAPSQLCLAPSGNGECFFSLKQSGALADMKARGIEWVFYYNVDNALVRVADPAFIGLASLQNHPIASKVIDLLHPSEKMGIVCLAHNRPAVLEYSELPESFLTNKMNSGDQAAYYGNTSMHLFRFDYIEQHADSNIPYHLASKKISYVDDNGNFISPAVPNAYKLERFIFDFFPYSDQMTVMKVKREEEFAPIKNKDGDDSPSSARTLLLALHAKWLRQAGVALDQLPEDQIEISSLISYSGEGLKQFE